MNRSSDSVKNLCGEDEQGDTSGRVSSNNEKVEGESDKVGWGVLGSGVGIGAYAYI